MKLLIPTVIPIDVPPQPGVEIIFYDIASAIPDEHHDAQAAVFWLNSFAQLQTMARDLTELRWGQGLMAGVDQLLTAGFGPNVQICAGVGLHDEPVAEHVIALILAAARRLDTAVIAQTEHRWARELGGNQIMNRSGFTTLSDARVMVWGYGNIGEALATRLRAFGADVVGVRRSPMETATRIIRPENVLDELPEVDVLVSLLPGTDSARNSIDQAVFDALPSHAWFVSAGRGSAVDEAALVTALESDKIAGAALDVFHTEPLPESHDLWSAPNVIITPHSAGGRPKNPERLIVDNLRRFQSGAPLKGLVQER